MNVVIDTNVLVSGLLRPHSHPGTVVRLISSGDIQLCVDARILSEYREVLARSRFDLNLEEVSLLLDYIRHYGHISSAKPLADPLTDPDDEPFLEVAIACEASCLVTGNNRHFPEDRRAGIQVFSPGEFLDYFRQSRSDTG